MCSVLCAYFPRDSYPTTLLNLKLLTSLHAACIGSSVALSKSTDRALFQLLPILEEKGGFAFTELSKKY